MDKKNVDHIQLADFDKIVEQYIKILRQYNEMNSIIQSLGKVTVGEVKNVSLDRVYNEDKKVKTIPDSIKNGLLTNMEKTIEIMYNSEIENKLLFDNKYKLESAENIISVLKKYANNYNGVANYNEVKELKIDSTTNSEEFGSFIDEYTNIKQATINEINESTSVNSNNDYQNININTNLEINNSIDNKTNNIEFSNTEINNNFNINEAKDKIS